MNCEAEISKFPDTILDPNGFTVRTSCQRCEIFLVHSLSSSSERDLISARNAPNIILQHCPKLIAEGFTEGQIPQELLPKFEIA